MKVPILLTKTNLVKPIERALIRLESIRQRKAINEDKLILEGLFVLAVSSFENSIIDTIREILHKIPDKLDINTETLSKEVIITGDTLYFAIENKISNISYKNIEEILKYFLKVTSLNETIISNENNNRLKEVKATRNLLIHNNLVLNGFYKETAGIYARTPKPVSNRLDRVTNRLEIDQEYLYQSIVILRDILQILRTNLETKYNSFTYINAVKSLFQYIFQTPVMIFENEFTFDRDNDKILSYNSRQSKIESLSSSETLFFNIWLSHFCARTFEFKASSFHLLDNKNKKKMIFFMNVIDILKS
jgi:hypothetical protein